MILLSGFGHPQENALPATTLHQTFRRSGFHGGRLVPRERGASRAEVTSRGTSRGFQSTSGSVGRGLSQGRGEGGFAATAQRGRGMTPRGNGARSVNCFTCGGYGHVTAQCPTGYHQTFWTGSLPLVWSVGTPV